MRATAVTSLLLLVTALGAVPSASALDCQETVPAAVASLAANAPAEPAVHLQWEGARRACVERTVVERSANGSVFEQVAQLGPGVQEYEDASVEDCTAYVYRVRQENAAGAGAPALVDATRHHGVPLAPTGFRPTDWGHSIRLDWDQAAEACPVRYHVEELLPGGTDPPRIWIPFSGPTFAIDGPVPACLDHRYELRASNVAGSSPAVTTWARLDNRPPSLPLGGASGQYATPTAMTLTWEDPQQDCGLDGFYVTIEDSTGTRTERMWVGDRSLTVGGLLPCERLTFTVTPFNRWGTGAGAWTTYDHIPLDQWCYASTPHSPVPLPS